MKKKIAPKTSTPTAPEPVQARREVSLETLEHRMKRIRNAVNLASAGAWRIAQQDDDDARDTAESVASLLDDIKSDLWWIALLPPVVSNMPVPSDDEAHDLAPDVQDDDYANQTRKQREHIAANYMRNALVENMSPRWDRR